MTPFFSYALVQLTALVLSVGAGLLSYFRPSPILGKNKKGQATLPDPSNWKGLLKFVLATFLCFALALRILISSSKMHGMFYLLIWAIIWLMVSKLIGYVAEYFQIPFAKPVKIWTLPPYNWFRPIQWIVSLVITVTCLQAHNWLGNNILSALMIVWILILCQRFSWKQASCILLGVMGYDVFTVYYSQWMASLLPVVAHSPMAVTAPSSISLSDPGLIAIGVIDLLCPGLVIMLALREAIERKQFSLVISTMVGSFIGSLVALFAFLVSGHMQPATLYVTPGAMLGYLAAAGPKRVLRLV